MRLPLGCAAELGSIENLELLFIDDGSTDDTLARIQAAGLSEPPRALSSLPPATSGWSPPSPPDTGTRQPWSVSSTPT
jgi:hypothetical protein